MNSVDTSFDLFAPTATDGYKVGHRPLYPEGTTFAYSNGTFRSTRLFRQSKSVSPFYDDKVVFFGISGAMREINGLWHRSFFSKPREAVVRRYARRMKHYLGENRVDAEVFGKLHDLGHLPIVVLALPEGARVKANVPAYVIYNTEPEFFWLVNYLETILSSMVWKMTTAATIAYEYRRVFEHWAERTGVDKAYVDIQGHDFSFRGVSGPEDAARIGSGHLVVFKGTDTLPAIDYVEDMYGANVEQEFVACSVVATEHAVATSNIIYNLKQMVRAEVARLGTDKLLYPQDVFRLQAEEKFIREILTEKHPTGIVSLVSDSFDFWGVISETAARLKDVILNRQPDEAGFAKTVFRPDSGDPVEVLCGRQVLTQNEFFNLTNGKEVTGTDDVLVQWGQSEKDLVRAYPGHIHPAPVGATALVNGYWIVPIEAAPLTPVEKGAVQVLWEIFGGTKTSTGHKVLHERVGLIYGDSITVERAWQILERLEKKGFASCNTVFGIGSYTYQYVTRDSLGFAIKSTAIGVGNERIDIFKAPKTEGDTLKKSAKGLLRVVLNDEGNYVLEQENDIKIENLPTQSGELKPVYAPGFIASVKLSEITNRLLDR